MRVFALAFLLLLASAAPAGAAVTSEVVDGTLTVRGDEEANEIELTVEGDRIAVDGTATTLAANTTARIVVNSFAGADRVDAGTLLADQYANLVFIGGEGDDLLTGGGRSDLLIWNEGDGDDTSAGGDGNDGVQVNGSIAAADVLSFGPALGGPARVALIGTAPTPFELNFEAERMEVNTFGGNDAIAPDPAAPTGIGSRTEPIVHAGAGSDEIDGGNGIDEIHGEGGSDRIDSGDGLDVLLGDEGSDLLNGGADEDALIGGPGEDTVNGGDGSDFILWFDGDGSDVADGGAGGGDELLVDGRGNAGDAFSYGPDPDGDGVLLSRTNLDPFTIEFDAEILSVNGNGGGDAIVPTGPTAIQTFLDGGGGDDEVTGANGVDGINGGGGADVLEGGAGIDQLFGEAGQDLVGGGEGNDRLLGGTDNDRLKGDGGQDQVFANEGSDVIAWNEGDGNDGVSGEAGFDRLEVNGSDAGGDDFNLVPELGITRLKRTNLTPFAIDFLSLTIPAERTGGVEEVVTNTGAGNDTFTVSPGLADLGVLADGGPGDDELTGAEEEDFFLGGTGNDTIQLGGGEDLVNGQEGDDRLFARDGESDVVNGGPDQDSALTDTFAIDVVSEVEDLNGAPPPIEEPPPPPPPVQQPPVKPPPPAADNVALLPRLGKVAVARKGPKLVAKVPVSCPANEASGCLTTLSVRQGSRGAVLGSKRLALAGGNRATASIPIPHRAAALARNGSLPVRIRIASTDAAGNTAARTVAVTLKLPR
jgi:Ca2+-binding RTX toxin-like protein